MKWPTLSMKSNKNDFSYGIDSTIAQILALTTNYLFSMKVGIDMMTPTIIIGAITDKESNTSYNPLPHISEEQTSWIGSLIYLFPPVGSVVVSFVQDRFGHRVCMMVTNVTHLLSVATLMLSDGPSGLYASSALMGFNVGFVTSFSLSYCGEVCEPKLRGTLTAVLNLFYFAGYLCVTMLYAVTADWRLSVLFTAILSVVNAAILFKTPDSPMWLMSRGRTDEAKSTFNKLRGGVGEDKFAVEYRDMVHYTSQINLPTDGEKKKMSSIKDSLYRFIEPETLKPLQLLMIMIFFTNLLSGIPYIPYLISVFDKFQVSFHPAWATTMYMAFNVAGNVLTICSINKLGKRFLALCTMATCSVCYLSIGIVGNVLPSSPVTSWIKIVLFFMSTFFSSMGIMPIVWILMCEIFPMKSKNVGAGLSSATYFILSFLMTKFYLDLEMFTGFYNTFVLFGSIGLIGLVYLHFQLPETENKTLNEISEHFKCKNTKADVQAGLA
ncbi:unnamed protein product [Macrosiphum euphorbiae]|uniref:Major facilitator superfamily (MFS) profile domain-containing protein n=1 Tax=Macrosiphum euphorbiae TaxID=13131 RepID=A0AAV0W035_9HEMI|nr:unnamed protein product [Macrosiphum euphorbiae]